MEAGSRRTARRAAAWVVTLIIAIAANARAQNVGSISGSLTDPQGLAVPGVSVTAVNRVSQVSESAVTDDRGRYEIGNVAFGTYVVTAVLSGFGASPQVVEVRSTVPVTADFRMTVGAVSVQLILRPAPKKSASVATCPVPLCCLAPKTK